MSCFGCFSFRRSAFKKESTSVAARAVTGKSPGEFLWFVYFTERKLIFNYSLC